MKDNYYDMNEQENNETQTQENAEPVNDTTGQNEYENSGYGNTGHENSGYENTGYENFGYKNVEQENTQYNRFEYAKCEKKNAAYGGDTSIKSGHRKPKNNSGKKMVAVALLCALVGGAAGAGVTALVGNDSSGTTILTSNRKASTVSLNNVDTGEEMTAAEVYANNVNSTVGITTTTTTNYFGYQTTSAASGSGFIVISDGYVVTNYHVVEDSDEIIVTTYDETSYDAELVGYDEDNDLAVLKIDADGLTPVVLGDSDNLNVGDSVVAIGNPLGELTFSLTAGTVSALNRSVTMDTNVTMKLIQTDAAINSGNSGGALFNMYGEVVGITNAKYSGSGSDDEASIDNIGFAIPINQVKDMITSIIESGTVEKPYIGVTISDLTEGYMTDDITEGALVQSVTEGEAADEAGLEEGDIITEVNGEAVSSSSEFASEISTSSAGDELEFTVYRDGEKMTLTVIIGTKTESALGDSDDLDSETDSEENIENGYGYGYGRGQGSMEDDYGREFYGNSGGSTF